MEPPRAGTISSLAPCRIAWNRAHPQMFHVSTPSSNVPHSSRRVLLFFVSAHFPGGCNGLPLHPLLAPPSHQDALGLSLLPPSAASSPPARTCLTTAGFRLPSTPLLPPSSDIVVSIVRSTQPCQLTGKVFLSFFLLSYLLCLRFPVLF